jgi:hypothetical protein
MANSGGTCGSVVQIMQENGKIRIVVDAGVWLAVLMPKARYEAVRPGVGDIVGLDIPTEAVRIF